MKQFLKSTLYILIAVMLGVGIAFAGSHNSVKVLDEVPLFALGVIIAFAMNWVAFIPAFIFQTEKYFDLTGSITFIIVAFIGALWSPIWDVRTIMVMIFVFIWASRLGFFLFKRILKEGKDRRFDEIKSSFIRYLAVWTLQGLWVSLTMAAALAIFTTAVKVSLGAWAIVGATIWLIGFVIETVADAQKSKWRAKPENKGKFIDVGLWSKSRHPNYFGEILIWIGIAIIAIPVLTSWQYFSLISPVFVIILLTRISGIPMLEKRADEKWGDMDAYKEYKKDTPVLIPKVF